jgi:hypothetical protein
MHAEVLVVRALFQMQLHSSTVPSGEIYPVFAKLDGASAEQIDKLVPTLLTALFCGEKQFVKRFPKLNDN